MSVLGLNFSLLTACLEICGLILTWPQSCCAKTYQDVCLGILDIGMRMCKSVLE